MCRGTHNRHALPQAQQQPRLLHFVCAIPEKAAVVDGSAVVEGVVQVHLSGSIHAPLRLRNGTKWTQMEIGSFPYHPKFAIVISITSLQ